MSTNDLSVLLRIRRSREELARRTVANQKQELLKQHRVLYEKNEQLTHFAAWKQEEECTLFQAITQHPVSPTELHAYRSSMTALIARQQALIQQLLQQQQLARQSEQALAEAKVNFLEKHRATEKCGELVRGENELMKIVQNARDDDELDEAALNQWITINKNPDQGV